MNKEYTIILPNERIKTYRYVTLFILLINCLVFGFIFFKSGTEKIQYTCLAAAIISVISLCMFLVFSKDIPAFWGVEISFIMISVFWLMLGKYLFALLLIFFAVVGFYTNKRFNVVFSVDHIRYPSFPVKLFRWNEVSNVILKDNILTIDLKNNKLTQAVVEKESASIIDEKEFNLFCQEQLLTGG